MKSTAGLLVELTLLTLVSGLAAPAIARGQAPKAEAQIPPVQEATGTIASIDQACYSFVLLPLGGRKKTEITFALSPEQTPWAHESDGCSFVSLGGNKMRLKPRTRLIVRYSALANSNLVNWVVVLGAKFSGRCEGQGGVSRTPGTIYQVGCDGIGDPTCVHCPHPPFPEEARRERLEGTVTLNIVILQDGSVSDAQIVQSLEKSLDESAIETVRKWRFKPVAGPDGSPVPVGAVLEVNFRLL